MSLSVIIPTYNRRAMVEKCLRALLDQSYDRAFYEIIIVDDGSTDGTDLFINEALKKPGPVLRCFRQEKKGPAAARNIGISNARGQIALFLGDDIMADRNLLKEHHEWHRHYPDENVGVLGNITWSKDISVTPFMEWLENGGPQFAFHKIRGQLDIDPERFFYSSNISLKRQFLLSRGGFFDETFPAAAYEDVELGYRLKKRGMKLKYNKDALAYHHHYTSLADGCQRMMVVGFASQIYEEKTGTKPREMRRPFWRILLGTLKFAVYYVIAKYYERRAVKEHIFKYVMEYYHKKGIAQYNARIKDKRCVQK